MVAFPPLGSFSRLVQPALLAPQASSSKLSAKSVAADEVLGKGKVRKTSKPRNDELKGTRRITILLWRIFLLSLLLLKEFSFALSSSEMIPRIERLVFLTGGSLCHSGQGQTRQTKEMEAELTRPRPDLSRGIA